mgnify:CR=1 FL=1
MGSLRRFARSRLRQSSIAGRRFVPYARAPSHHETQQQLVPQTERERPRAAEAGRKRRRGRLGRGRTARRHAAPRAADTLVSRGEGGRAPRECDRARRRARGRGRGARAVTRGMVRKAMLRELPKGRATPNRASRWGRDCSRRRRRSRRGPIPRRCSRGPCSRPPSYRWDSFANKTRRRLRAGSWRPSRQRTRDGWESRRRSRGPGLPGTPPIRRFPTIATGSAMRGSCGCRARENTSSRRWCAGASS